MCCVQEKVCGGREEPQTFYVGAIDWKASDAGSLNADIYENDLRLLDGDPIGAFKRISKPIDRASPAAPAVVW